MTIAPTPLHGHGSSHHYGLALAGALALVAVALLVRHDVFQSESGSGAIEGSGVVAAEARDVPPFARVELAGSNNVTIHVGERQSVVIHADDNLLGQVTTRVERGTLVLGTRRTAFAARAPMDVVIGVRRLEELTLSGSGTIDLSGLDSRR